MSKSAWLLQKLKYIGCNYLISWLCLFIVRQKKQSTIAVYLDFSKAFNTVNHEILIVSSSIMASEVSCWAGLSLIWVVIIIMIKIIYHDFLPTPTMGSHVKSDKTHTHTVIKTHHLAHILDTWALIFSSCTSHTVYPNLIM